MFLIDFFVNPADEFPSGWIGVRLAGKGFVDPFLAGDMGQGFLLHLSFGGTLGVVLPHCLFFFDRVSAVALDQVEVVTVGDSRRVRE